MSSRIKEYFESIKNKKVAFIGLGRSNLPLMKMFCDAGAVVFACDSRDEEALGTYAELARSYGATLRTGKNYLDDLDIEMAFRTPGMNFNHPSLVKMRDKGIFVTSEMELFFELCPCRIVAVTGSDGKTTTTTIISELLKEEGYTVHLGGNIGNSLMPEIFNIKPQDFAVVELSSFQMISMSKSPCVSVVTNVSPNHLDVHKDMDEYIDAKRNIVKYQSADEFAVLNLDNDISSSFENSTNANVYKFSRRNEVERGAFVCNDVIYFRDESGDIPILNVNDIIIPGLHNVENYMAAICAVRQFVSVDTILKVARNFTGVKHRAQLVRTFEGVRYYNDSIASSPTRTVCGMLSLFDQKIILICGGYDKNIPYAPLGPVICSKVKVLILLGATGPKIEQAVRESEDFSEGAPVILYAKSMEEAVNIAKDNAVCGDIVALSPASASFDMYKDFEERGEHFMSIVKGLE